MHHRLLVHIVWTTREREPTIDSQRAAYLCEHLPIIARQERVHILAIGIVATHLHLLVRVHPSTSLPRLLQRMKGGTAHAINWHFSASGPALRWAKGYSATTVSPRQAGRAVSYIRHQSSHHPTEAIPGWTGQSQKPR
ncbi:MAG TPA: IS200/IS605 family transposase [Gemmatimonadales bacterium]|nr:IS200/IS605 family transposase [Gemmatimonadales bacterium]